jgi:hypothetical protein
MENIHTEYISRLLSCRRVRDLWNSLVNPPGHHYHLLGGGVEAIDTGHPRHPDHVY